MVPLKRDRQVDVVVAPVGQRPFFAEASEVQGAVSEQIGTNGAAPVSEDPVSTVQSYEPGAAGNDDESYHAACTTLF